MNNLNKNSKKIVYILCDGGLANRINSLITGLFFKNYFSIERCIVIWPVNNWCRAGINEVMDLDCLKDQVDDIQEDLCCEDLILITHLNKNFDSRRGLSIYNPFLSKLIKSKRYSSERGYLVATDLPPFWMWGDNNFNAMEKLIYNALLLKNSAHIYNSGSNNIYGVHIRQTDFPNKDRILKRSIKYIERLMRKSKEVCIFSDSNIVLELVSSRWPLIKINRNEQPTINSGGLIERGSESVKAAAVDMLLLANTKIVRTSESSFLDLAIRFSKLNAFNKHSILDKIVDLRRNIGYMFIQIRRLIKGL